MFLTRLGFGSKMVVTGDVTQVDLPSGTQSGLRLVQDILDGIDDVHFCRADQRTTSCGTGWSATSSTPTAAGTPAERDRRRAAAAAGRAGPGRRNRPRDGDDGRRAARRGSGTDTTAGGRRSGDGVPDDARRAGEREPMSIEVNNESGVERRRGGARRAGPLRARRGCASTRSPSCRSLLVDAEADGAAARAVDGRAGPDRRAVLPDGRAAPGREDDGARAGAARRRRALPAGGQAAGRARPGTAPRTSCSCCARTASCTCSATTTRSRTRSRRCSACRASCCDVPGRARQRA